MFFFACCKKCYRLIQINFAYSFQIFLLPGTEDQIDESTIKVVVGTNSSKDVLIQWDPPPRPNGVIIKYHIYYKKANQENVSTDSFYNLFMTLLLP